MSSFQLTVNGKPVTVEADPAMPLLWVLRDLLGLKGTKFGCGRGLCGACTVQVGGEAVRSCALPLELVKGAVTTVEGLAGHAVQRAWLELDVAQCGYCQPGQMMACAALLAETPHPSDADIAASMTNLCRCGTYGRIKRAILRAAELAASTAGAAP
jgi:isoquinoline 1-oxidoreductase alpha subunit